MISALQTPTAALSTEPFYAPRQVAKMSADLVWMLTRKQNCFIRQKKGSGGDQLVRPNRFARSGPPWRSGCSGGRGGVRGGGDSRAALPPLPVADRPLCVGRAVHQRAEQPDAEALVQILRPGKPPCLRILPGG